MGWSCNAAASLTLDKICQMMLARGAHGSNTIVQGGKEYGFWESSRREHADGAITGSVYRYVDASQTHVRKSGSFRIEPNGKITRFAGISPSDQQAAQREGAKTFRERYGNEQANHEGVINV